MQDTRIYKITNLSPIGFKIVNYPVQYCSVCRGYLNEVCSACMEKNLENCNVVNNDGSYYHQHCYTFISSAPKKPLTKPKKYIDSEDEESA